MNTLNNTAVMAAATLVKKAARRLSNITVQQATLVVAALLLISTSQGLRADVLADIQPLQTRWAEINYQLEEDKREKAYISLLAEADKVVAANASSAEAYIWRGIIKSSFAGAKGGLGALSVAEESKADLERGAAIRRECAARFGLHQPWCVVCQGARLAYWLWQ